MNLPPLLNLSFWLYHGRFSSLPLVNIASDQKRARFLSLLREVGKETLTSEPDCLAYIWLLSVTETTAIRGVEIYRNDSALEDTHRRSTAYEKFRTVLIEEQLAPPPTAAALCRGRLVEKSRLPDPVNSSGPLVAITGSVSVLTITYARSEEILAILGKVADEPREKDQIAFVISDLEESRQILVVGVFASRKAADRARSTWKSLGQGILSSVLEDQEWEPSGVGFLRCADSGNSSE